MKQSRKLVVIFILNLVMSVLTNFLGSYGEVLYEDESQTKLLSNIFTIIYVATEILFVCLFSFLMRRVNT